MNLAGLKHRVKIRLNDQNGIKFKDSFITDMLNEGLRVMCRDTLCLETKSSSLTYSSNGFALPSDFIKVKKLLWVNSNGYYNDIEPQTIDYVLNMRNKWVDIDSNQANSYNPQCYAIHNGYIVLDSTTQTSPVLYYYKYDTAMSSDTSSPSINSEFHKYLIDYASYELDHSMQENLMNWERGLMKIRNVRPQTQNVRSKYIGL